jgi:uncharacterized protein YidB (DUF937 family)
MLALLGLLAVAGYQNRDRIGELLGRATGQPNRDPSQPGALPGNAGSTGMGGGPGMGGGLGGLLGGLLGGGSGGASGITGGLSDLLESFTGNGHGETANSWIQTGPNKQLNSSQLEQALGTDTMQELARHTGLSRDELLTRLTAVLPTAIDKMTPEGRLPTEAEAMRLVG